MKTGVRVRFSGWRRCRRSVRVRRLRCGLCGEMYTANTPRRGEQKYDETVPAVIGLLRYVLSAIQPDRETTG